MATAQVSKRKYDDINGSLGSVFGDPRFSDLVVKCKDRTWKLHRVIVCARCEFFDKACSGTFQEASTRTITLDDDPPDAVEAMLHFLYTSEFKDDPNKIFDLPISVHIIAEKYDLPKLQALAKQYFADALDAPIVEETSDDKHLALKIRAVQVAAGIETLYRDGGDRQAELRKLAVKWVIKHGKVLLAPGGDATFRRIGESMSAFAMDLVAETFQSGHGGDYKCYRCHQCGYCFVHKAFVRTGSVFIGTYSCPRCTRREPLGVWDQQVAGRLVD